MPLRTNPWYARLRYIIQYPATLLQPGDYPGQLLFSFQSNNKISPTRHHSSGRTKNNNYNRYYPTVRTKTSNRNSDSSTAWQQQCSNTNLELVPLTTTSLSTQPIVSSMYSGITTSSYKHDNLKTTDLTLTLNNDYSRDRDQVVDHTRNKNVLTIREELVGRRYQTPTIFNMVAQIIYALVIGLILSYVTIHSSYSSYFHQYDASSYSSTLYHSNHPTTISLITVCCLSSLVPILPALFGNESHEIKVTFYLYPFAHTTAWISIIRHHINRIVISTILVPLIGICLEQIMFSSEYNNIIKSLLRIEFVHFMIFTFMVTTYMYIMDEMMRLYVIHCFNVDGHLKQLTDEIKFDPTYQTTLHTILSSLFYHDSNIVSEIVRITYQDRVYYNEPRVTSNGSSREREELDRCYLLIQQMAQLLLSSLLSSSFLPSNASTSNPTSKTQNSHYNTLGKKIPLLSCFEDDVLRLLFLESIGGSEKIATVGSMHDSTDRLSQQNQQQLQQQSTSSLHAYVPSGSRRHQNEIKRWIDIKPLNARKSTTANYIHSDVDDDIYHNKHDSVDPHVTTAPTCTNVKQQRQDIAISLTRGLAVFIGGYGEALSLCASPTRMVLPTGHYIESSSHRDSIFTWTLSASAIVALQFAVQGITRCVQQSFQPQTGPGQMMMDSILTSLIPTILTSFFYLRVGIVKYSKYQSQQSAYINGTSSTHGTSSSSCSNVSSIQKVRLYNVDLFQLLQVTDTSALSILRVVQSHRHVYINKPSSSVRLELDEDVMQWTQRLLTKDE
jgi:hypothetical protein